MYFKIVGEITEIHTIAVDNSIREIKRLRKFYGLGRWRKIKGVGNIRFKDGTMAKAELHWYECHGIGKKEMKIKYLL